MCSSERVPFTMFVILLKWRKRRVGGNDYGICFYRKVNIRLMTPNCAPSCYKAFRSARDEVMRLIRSAKVGSLILPTMLALLFERAIRSPLFRSPAICRLHHADRKRLVYLFGFQLRSGRCHRHYHRNRITRFDMRLNTPYSTRCYVSCTNRSMWLSSL